MILTEFPFGFFSDRALFSEKWGRVLSGLSGRRIVNIFGVWDNIDNEWFGEAPMLVEFAHGTLAVSVRSEKYLALAWNEILPGDKPQWFSENAGIHDWHEDLEWRGYSPLAKFKGAEISRAEIIGGENALNGLRFETDKGGFSIADVGDVIAGITETRIKMHDIRKVTEKDIPECVQVIRRSFQTVADEFGFTAEKDPKFTSYATTEERLNYHMFTEKRPMYACFVDGKIAGYYSLHIDGGEVELSNLCTLPEYRHRNIGETLMLHSFDRARELGFSEITIGVVDANERVKRWYENFGFAKSGECDAYITFHCIFMKRPL